MASASRVRVSNWVTGGYVIARSFVVDAEKLTR
jgi:hypothetical protein